MYYYIFVFSFIFVAIVYAVLAAFTTVLYKRQPITELSQAERDILYKRASMATRMVSFVTNLLGSVFAPQVYISAVVITVLVFLFQKFGGV